MLIARIAACSAVRDMGKEHSVANGGVVRSSSLGATKDVDALVILLNVITVDLGSLYVSTRSIVVTAIAAGLGALLCLSVVVWLLVSSLVTGYSNVGVHCALCPV
ncbi:MAG: hypothetical protein ACRDRU_25155, partial [Pseudonocardiaceae bacterium]